MRNAHIAGLRLSPTRTKRAALLVPAPTRPGYALAVASETHRHLAAAWLVLGVAALVAAGVLAIILVVARTPGLGALFPSADFFRLALVAHVDLSVLVWFLAFAGVLWTINSGPRALGAGWAALALVAAGALAITTAPFVTDGSPVM